MSAEAGFRCGLAAIVGRPNVGKSTLFNALLGARISIVSRRKQTTRNRIRGILNRDASQVVLMDTPGWQSDEDGEIDRLMRTAAERSAPDADCIVAVLDVLGEHRDDERVLALCPESKPAVCALNKTDKLASKDRALTRIGEVAAKREFDAIVPISALKGDGVGELAAVLGGLMPESPPLFGRDSKHDLTERFVVEEFVREKVFRYLRDELPYAVAVELVRSERKGSLLRLYADVHVDQHNRKHILIGRGGEMMKRIGRAARLDLEKLLGVRIHLELRVKVTPRWSRSGAMLRRFGVGEGR